MKKEYSIIILILACMLIILSSRAFTSNKAYQKPDIDNGSIDLITYVFPGEFEKQQAIWLLWPEGMYSAASEPIYPVYIDIIKALAPHDRVNLISQSKEEVTQIEDLLKANGYSGKNINYHIIDHLSIWARDVGPVFVKDSQNRLNVVNFGFNNYGRGASQDYIDVESTYWIPGRSDKLKTTEDQVKGIFQSVFPERTIIGINAESVNLWGGGIHCITQHMPAN